MALTAVSGNIENNKKSHLWMDTKKERRKINDTNKRGIR